MRKLSLLLIAIVLSFASYSQTFYRIIHSAYSEYEYGSWVKKLDRDNTDENLYAIVDGSSIKFNNESKTSFITYGEAEHDDYGDHKTSTWSAYDKNGERCYVMIKVSNINIENASIIIAYVGNDARSFEYSVKLKN